MSDDGEHIVHDVMERVAIPMPGGPPPPPPPPLLVADTADRRPWEEQPAISPASPDIAPPPPPVLLRDSVMAEEPPLPPPPPPPLLLRDRVEPEEALLPPPPPPPLLIRDRVEPEEPSLPPPPPPPVLVPEDVLADEALLPSPPPPPPPPVLSSPVAADASAPTSPIVTSDEPPSAPEPTSTPEPHPAASAPEHPPFRSQVSASAARVLPDTGAELQETVIRLYQARLGLLVQIAGRAAADVDDELRREITREMQATREWCDAVENWLGGSGRFRLR